MHGFCIHLSGQGRFFPRVHIEAGTGVNLAFFDVGGGSPGLSLQGGVLYDLNPHWRLGVNIGTHRARGTDAGTPDATRGYEFRSNLNEISAKGVYVFRFKHYPIKKWKTKLEPRAFVSLGILQFIAKPNDQLASLGNGDYLPVAPLLAGGIGFAYHMERDLSLLIEGGCNGSSSDYLEGLANSGDLPLPDFFLTILIKFIYKVPNDWQ